MARYRLLYLPSNKFLINSLDVKFMEWASILEAKKYAELLSTSYLTKEEQRNTLLLYSNWCEINELVFPSYEEDFEAVLCD